MYKFETKLLEEGYRYICGIDEAGRGPLAGPVFAAAVILDIQHIIPGINDSKQLSRKRRLELEKLIKAQAVAYAVVAISEQEIDQINIYQASRKAMMQAYMQLNPQPDFILTDAMKLPEAIPPVLDIIKGDEQSGSIAAASILAKTERDRYMEQMAILYPEYGFERHKGYPTKEHLATLGQFGPSPIHRMSYKPVMNSIIKQERLELEFDENE